MESQKITKKNRYLRAARLFFRQKKNYLRRQKGMRHDFISCGVSRTKMQK